MGTKLFRLGATVGTSTFMCWNLRVTPWDSPHVRKLFYTNHGLSKSMPVIGFAREACSKVFGKAFLLLKTSKRFTYSGSYCMRK